jgi:hypothetical protein
MTTVSTADWIAACVGPAKGEAGLVLGERHQTNLLAILTKCAPQACAPRAGAQICATTPRCGRFNYTDTETMKDQCKSSAGGFEELLRMMRSELKKLASKKEGAQHDATDALAPFETALTFLMNPTRQANVPDTKPTLLELIRAEVTEDFVWQHRPNDGVIKAIGDFTEHVRNNLNTLLAEEYGINVREDMCKDPYKGREELNDVTHTLRTYASTLVKNLAKTRNFVYGKETAATVTTVLTAAVKECLPEIWLSVWTEVSATVYSLLCMVYGLQFTVYSSSLQFTVYGLLFTVYSLLLESTVYCLLSAVNCLLSTVCCLLFTVYF